MFLSAHRALVGGSEPREPAAWLATIARNECRGRIRARMQTPLSLSGDTEDRAPGPPAEALRRCDLAVLWQEIRGLPRPQQEALLLREFGGLSYTELAGALGVSVPAVESLLFRARTRLRDRLDSALAGLNAAGGLAGLRNLLAGAGSGAVAAKAVGTGVGVAVLAGGAIALPKLVDPPRVHPPTRHATFPGQTTRRPPPSHVSAAPGQEHAAQRRPGPRPTVVPRPKVRRTDVPRPVAQPPRPAPQHEPSPTSAATDVPPAVPAPLPALRVTAPSGPDGSADGTQAPPHTGSASVEGTDPTGGALHGEGDGERRSSPTSGVLQADHGSAATSNASGEDAAAAASAGETTTTASFGVNDGQPSESTTGSSLNDGTPTPTDVTSIDATTTTDTTTTDTTTTITDGSSSDSTNGGTTTGTTTGTDGSAGGGD